VAGTRRLVGLLKSNRARSSKPYSITLPTQGRFAMFGPWVNMFRHLQLKP
jgi:hypothetical protein